MNPVRQLIANRTVQLCVMGLCGECQRRLNEHAETSGPTMHERTAMLPTGETYRLDMRRCAQAVVDAYFALPQDRYTVGALAQAMWNLREALKDTDIACPKCGGTEGWFGPTYDSFSDKLVYRCKNCRYLVFVPCKDSQETR